MSSDDFDASKNLLEATGQYKVLTRVPESLTFTNKPSGQVFKAAVIDLETTGLDPEQDEIIEIGTLIVSFSNEDGFLEITFTNNQLQQPSTPISAEITQITGITNEDVEGKSIDWKALAKELSDVQLIICHNAAFDRNFMELQTPEFFSQLIQSKAFGCSSRDVNWRALGFEGAKLEYLNLKMGFFYEGHRALVDCWATINLFIQTPEAFEELKNNVRAKEQLICALNAPFDQKDVLKKRGYKWSDGSKSLPKSWWIIVPADQTDNELDYLMEDIYGGRQIDLPQKVITARSRYSKRAYQLN